MPVHASSHLQCLIAAQIKDQWRRLCKQHHPDLQVGGLAWAVGQLSGCAAGCMPACMASLGGVAQLHQPQMFPCSTVRARSCLHLCTCIRLALALHHKRSALTTRLTVAHLSCLQPEHMRHQAEQYFKEISSAYRTLTAREWFQQAGPPCWAPALCPPALHIAAGRGTLHFGQQHGSPGPSIELAGTSQAAFSPSATLGMLQAAPR